MSLVTKINPDKIPTHVAIIMDGNGRWAKQKGKPRVFGHQNAVKAVRAATEAAAQIGVKYLTLYAFSAENWKRPKTEVDALMALLSKTIDSEINTLIKNNIKLKTIGDQNLLPDAIQKKIIWAKEQTKSCTGLVLNIAISYGSRDEILNAAMDFAKDISKGNIDINNITNEKFGEYLYTSEIPDPDLLIRTSGEYRISNFLLWQIAYSELYFTNVLWPDFSKDDFYAAIISYQGRERRYGKISDQL
ncbi:MAG TPA: isoprenyl transferase [Tenuifilaceae bacterium]|nr:isoprenyl transferase [Tenuifilaceae bacterium]HPE17886.1 isoprenyl transferase [Tenuifilaceae bacterium]HPJ45363.1 isoprenyl transferase [Tenuifilaceae bacterium]HPQ33604.1 isoprenyl transferase [Tenuifilaceae bacterium]HRX67383.1 isoprenyl transferase [Tenuifilaceae bacterium]